MGKMKSALEIALEKAKKISLEEKKTPDDIEQKKFMKAAAFLGNSFLQGKVEKKEVRESILRYPEKYRKAAIASFIEQITEEMDLENTPKILQAITYIEEDEYIRNACRETEKLYHQYRKMMKEKLSQLQESTSRFLRKRLEREGIKGSAVANFNIKKRKEWKEASAQIQKEYREILERFRSSLFKQE
ncbi:MAG TPA: hypothetical protein GX004_06345 [Firmicutes bacterium]|nr:hypothetical protein [Bacillota bacterium]